MGGGAMIVYIEKSTDKRYHYLATAELNIDGKRLLIAVYCPDDNEHTIFALPHGEFEESFSMGL